MGSGRASGRKTPPVSVTSIDPVERRVAAAPAQTISPERAASLVASDMWLDYGPALCQPDVFDRALAARVREVSNVKIRHCLTMRPRAVLDADPEGEHVHYVQPAFLRLRPEEARRGALPLHPGQSRRDLRLLPALHAARRTSSFQDVPGGRARLLQSQRRQPVASRHHRARQAWSSSRRAAAAVRLRRADRRPHQRGGLHDRGRRRPARRSCPIRRSATSTPRSDGSSPPRSRTATACRSASAPCPTPCARCCSRAACATSACTPR